MPWDTPTLQLMNVGDLVAYPESKGQPTTFHGFLNLPPEIRDSKFRQSDSLIRGSLC